MANSSYIYQTRAVAFLDVLGFQEKLKDFEKDAITFKQSEEDEHFDDLTRGQSLFSPKANEFIEIFLQAISRLDKKKFKYYLFSDNICITAQTDDSNLLVELLQTINDLFYTFATKGYFLRGGIDFGNFINQDTIALGIPLARAYHIEQSDAVFPRVVLSKEFINVLEVAQSTYGPREFYLNELIKKSCEIYYLNVFLKIFDTDNKELFFESMHQSIVNNLALSSDLEKVHIKYEWLAKEFNIFIDHYCDKLVFAETDSEPDATFLERVQSFKIKLNGN